MTDQTRGCCPPLCSSAPSSRSSGQWSARNLMSNGSWSGLARGHVLLEGVPEWQRRSPSAPRRRGRRAASHAAVHAGPDARRNRRHPVWLGSSERFDTDWFRSSPTWCWPTRSNRRPPRSSRPYSRRWPNARSPSGARLIGCRRRFGVGPQNPIETEGVYTCLRHSGTGSCSRSTSTTWKSRRADHRERLERRPTSGLAGAKSLEVW